VITTTGSSLVVQGKIVCILGDITDMLCFFHAVHAVEEITGYPETRIWIRKYRFSMNRLAALHMLEQWTHTAYQE
jgi:hypothetical protein